MRVQVKLYGTLARDTDSTGEGIEVELPERAKPKALLDALGIPESARPLVVVDGRVLGTEDELAPGASVRVFQAISGG